MALLVELPVAESDPQIPLIRLSDRQPCFRAIRGEDEVILIDGARLVSLNIFGLGDVVQRAVSPVDGEGTGQTLLTS